MQTVHMREHQAVRRTLIDEKSRARDELGRRLGGQLDRRRAVAVAVDDQGRDRHRAHLGAKILLDHRAAQRDEGPQRYATPIQIATRLGVVSFLSTTTIFGTPTDVTLSELALEMLFPADEHTVAIVKTMVEEERASRAAPPRQKVG